MTTSNSVAGGRSKRTDGSARRPRVIMVAPNFPPHPSPTGQRARNLARYAPGRGWDMEVIAVDPAFYEDTPDWELMRFVDGALPVIRTAALPPRLTRLFGIGDLGLRSHLHLRAALIDRCRVQRPDILYFPGGPFYAFRLGAEMRAKLGIPYVIDYTDPWVYPPMPGQEQAWKKGYWASRVAGRLEPQAARNAAHIVAVSDATNDRIRACYPELPASRFSAVPFGAEPADFAALRANPRPNRFWDSSDGHFHFVYVGAMLPHGHGTLKALFQALLQLRQESELFARLRLHFFGTTYDPRAPKPLVMPTALEMGLGHVVDEHPKRIPYIDALNVLTSADGILALGSTDRHYTASKIYPCILAQRPLLTIFHEASTVCDVVRATNAGELVTYGDEGPGSEHIREIAGAIRRMMTPGSYDAESVRLEHLAPYTAEASSNHILSVFDSIVHGVPMEEPRGAHG